MDALRNRISHYSEIQNTSFEALDKLAHRIETRRPGADIVTIGETVDYVFVIEKGWAIRYRMLEDGRRQILNFMLPGDCFDLMSLTKAKSDHAISAATEVTIRRLKANDFLQAVNQNGGLATAFWWASIQEDAILREQIIRVGRRSARERVGHMLLELNRRSAATLGKLSDFVDLPVPQTLIADALGLSVVHVSRTMSTLKREGYIDTHTSGVEILKREALAQMCDFDSRYLHLDKLKL